VSVTAHVLVRGQHELASHGRLTDGSAPGSALAVRLCRSAAYDSHRRRAVCKTVGSAYVGSNPTPATTCEDGPLAGNSRLCGPFLLCPVVCHLVALRAAVSRCPRTYSGPDSCPITVGAHRRLFHGRPRTGRAGDMYRLYARRSVGSWHLGDRDDGVSASGTPGLMSVRRTRPSLAPSPRQTEPGCPVGGSAGTCTPSAGTGPRPRSR
jgi:hypothetical protein